MLMFRRRGVLHPEQIAPVVTFGAPAVFCEGSGGVCTPDAAACSIAPSVTSTLSEDAECAGAEAGLLSGLGLGKDHIVNVIMTRDIVPRAFACDYSLVADLLRSWGAGFKDHCCLAREGRKHLYFFVGEVLVLQPSEVLKFAAQEPLHSMLPPCGGLWALRMPETCAVTSTVEDEHAALSTGGGEDTSGDSSGGSDGMVGSSTKAARPPGVSAEMTEAVCALMDNPHPLDILGDAGAYGDLGSISRYHNPTNYTCALGRVLKERQAAARSDGIVHGVSKRVPVAI